MLDIETSPNIAPVWSTFNPHIDVSQLVGSSYILCWAAKFLGDETVMWKRACGRNGQSRKAMLNGIHGLLDKADAVVHYNGSAFDIPVLNKEFLLHGIPKPAPYTEIDLLKAVRKQFRFTSNKLDYVVKQLDLGAKVKHRGLELWLGCMNNDEDCWEEMESYNRHDVVILEKLYYKILPWLKNHMNYSLHSEGQVCPNCGSPKYIRRGFTYTGTGKYQRYICRECGAWYRGSKSLIRRGERMVSL